MSLEKRVNIIDCSIRDGGYVNSWKFSKELVRETYRSLSKSGVDYVELGFRNSEKYFNKSQSGLWQFCSEVDLAEVTKNIQGAKIAVMGDYGKIELDDLNNKGNSCIDLVRVAVHKNKVFDAIDLLEKIKTKGYQVSLQCMAYSAYTAQERQELLKALAETKLDFVYVGDSYGSVFPFQIKELFEPFLELGTSKIGFHPHNNIQMSFANTLEAIRVGVDIVDTTIYGIGRGAGNLPTEILLAYFIAQGKKAYNVIPVLDCIERYYLDLMEDTPWGYQLPYMISGIFASHPSYSKELLRRQEYSMSDIWKSLEYIDKLKPLGFDKSIIDDLINKGLIGNLENINGKNGSHRTQTHAPKKPLPKAPYIGRHKNRDFLVLANGPTLREHKSDLDQLIKKYNPVVLGANFLDGLFVPDYHAFNNKKRFVSYVNTVSPQSKLIIGSNIPAEMIDEYVDREFESLYFNDILDDDFYIQDGVIGVNCRTISVLLVGLAVVMGAERIYVAGMDGYMNPGNMNSTLFYDEKFDPKEHHLNMDRHNLNDHFLGQIDEHIRDSGGEGVHILTPTSHSSFYKSIHHYL